MMLITSDGFSYLQMASVGQDRISWKDISSWRFQPHCGLSLTVVSLVSGNTVNKIGVKRWQPLLTCCPWSHGLRPKKLSASVEVPPAPVPRQRPLAPSVTSVTSVANDKDDNEIVPGLCRSPGICLTVEENPRKPQLGDCLMKGLCNQSSSPQMRSLSSK